MVRDNKGEDSGEIRRSRDKRVANAVKDFDETIELAGVEYSETLPGAVERANNDPTTSPEVVADVISHVIPESERILEEREENLQEQAREIFLTEQEVREFIGMLEPQGTSVEKIEALEIEARNYRQKAVDEEDPQKKKLYEKFSEVAEMKADTIRIRIGDPPQHVDVIEIVKDKVKTNDLNRLEKFRKWLKENKLSLFGIALGIAGIVTTVVRRARNVVSKGEKAVGNFAKALANLVKHAGPLLGPILNLVAQALTWVAKGISWLAENVWALAIFIVWLLYDYWTKRQQK